MDLKVFEYDDWRNFFSGKWSILSASYWGVHYAKQPFSKLVDRFVTDTVLIYRRTTGLSGYFRSSQIDKFTSDLAAAIEKDTAAAEFICNGLKERADSFLALVDKQIGKDIDLAQYLSFQETLMEYYIYHIQNKYAPEQMNPATLEKLLPLFESARVHAEPVFMRSEDFMRELAKIQAEKTGLKPELVLAMVDHEYHQYLESGQLPEKELLEERLKGTALVTHNQTTEALTGSQFKEVEDILSQDKSGVIKGTTAFPGKVEGVARLVFDPTKADDFEEGEILVTKMTRPDYLPLMKKAAAFVTDGGGILCHAAIVARELKKPCVIGTQGATEQIKDGDSVEVDADRGEVRVVE